MSWSSHIWVGFAVLINLAVYFSSAASTCLTLREIENELTEVTAADWFPLGVQLGVRPATLREIEKNYPQDTQRCKTEVLDLWLRNAPEVSWKNLAQAVEAMGEYTAVAKRLRRKVPPIPQENHVTSVTSPIINGIPDGHQSVTANGTTDSHGETTFHQSMVACNRHRDIYSMVKTDPPFYFQGLDLNEDKLIFDTRDIQSEFNNLFTKVRRFLVSQGVTVDDFVLFLEKVPGYGGRSLFDAEISDLREATNLTSVFRIVRSRCSWFNHAFLSDVVESYCEDNKRIEKAYKDYCTHLQRYCKNRVKICPLKNGFGFQGKKDKKMIVKVDREWEVIQIQQLEEVVCSLARILKVRRDILKLACAEKGCVKLTLLVPSYIPDALFPLTAEQETTILEMGVTEFQCEMYHFSCQGIGIQTQYYNVKVQLLLSANGHELELFHTGGKEIMSAALNLWVHYFFNPLNLSISTTSPEEVTEDHEVDASNFQLHSFEVTVQLSGWPDICTTTMNHDCHMHPNLYNEKLEHETEVQSAKVVRPSKVEELKMKTNRDHRRAAQHVTFLLDHSHHGFTANRDAYSAEFQDECNTKQHSHKISPSEERRSTDCDGGYIVNDDQHDGTQASLTQTLAQMPTKEKVSGRSTREYYMGRFRSFMNKLTCGLGQGIGNIFTRNQQPSCNDMQTHHCDCDDSTNQSNVPLQRQHRVHFDSSELPFNSASDEDMADFFRDNIRAENVRHFPFMRFSPVDHPRNHSPFSIGGYSGLRSTYTGSHSSSSGYSGSRSSSSGYSGSRSSHSGHSRLHSLSSGYSGSHSSSSGYSGLRSSSSGYSGLHSSSSGYSGLRSFSSGYSGLHSSSSGYSGLHSSGSVYSMQPEYLNPSSHLLPSISDEVIQTVLSCLLHTSNCQIPNCLCKLVQLRYRELLQKQHNQINNAFDTNIYRSHLSLSSQNLSSETYPHHHLRRNSHIRQVTKPSLQRKHSKNCDLTPVTELREISISAESLPELCLNDCPLAPTPVKEGQTLPFSTMHLRSRQSSMPNTTVKENSRSTSSLETVESNASSQSSSLEMTECKLLSRTARPKHSGRFVPSQHPKREFISPVSSLPSGYRREESASPVSLHLSQHLTRPILLNPSGYKHRQSVSPYPSHPIGYMKGEPVPSNPYLTSQGGKSATPAPSYLSRHSPTPILLDPSGYKHRQSVGPYPSHSIGYKKVEPVPSNAYLTNHGVESGYDSTPENITPWTHRWEQSKSGYMNNGNSKPILASLSRKAHELRQTEMDIKPHIMETLV